MHRIETSVASITDAGPARSESAPEAARTFDPVDPDLFEFEELQPRGSAGTPGRTDVETGHLTFHGGKVLASPDVVPIYVGGYWLTLPGKRDRARNDAAMMTLVKDPGQTALWQEYGGGQGTTSRSKVLAGVEGERFTKEDVEALVAAEVRKGHLDTSDPERVFTLVLPPGAVLEDGGASSQHGLGGFHGNVETGDGRPVYYAVVVYSQRTAAGVNGIDFTGKPIDNVTITESHEITEVVTDPDVGQAIETGDPELLAWYDDTTPILRRDGSAVLDDWGRPMRGKGEIGDIPILNAELEGDKDLSSAWGRVEGFAFQTEWSNADGKAELAPDGE
jgi:hypothetical protein